MGPDGQLRTQQSRASGAVYLSKYFIFVLICVGFRLCYVQSLVCVMYSLLSVLCEVFSLCYVKALVCVTSVYV